MLGTIYRSGVMSDIYHSGVQFNLDYTFCSYTTNTASQSADIKLSLPAGKKITIFWGDGTSTVITGAVSTITYSHTYTDIGAYNLTVSGDYNDITYLKFEGDGSYGGDIKDMPVKLIKFISYDFNTFVGNLQNLQNFLPELEVFVCLGSNTFTGDLQNFPSKMRVFKLAGLNTFTGNLKYLSDSLKLFICCGFNTISEYTGKTWIKNFEYFQIVPVAPGGLSSAEMDLLLNDLNEDLDWSGGGTIVLTGSNAPPTGAGQTAIDNIVAEGGTVVVNDYSFCSYTTSAENQSADIKLSLPAGKKITIFWGDGTSTVITGAVTKTTYSHAYTDIGTYNLTVSGDYNDITYLRFEGDGEYNGDIKYFPDNLTYFKVIVKNTFYGIIKDFSSFLVFLGLGNNSVIIGKFQDLPVSLEHYDEWGDGNIIDGDLANLSEPIVSLGISPNGNITYSGKTWLYNFNYFTVIAKENGLSSAEIDQLIIDLDEDLDWSGGGIITLTGTNEPPENKGIDAIENIVAEGGTVFVNDYVYSPLRATDTGAVRICDDNAIRITT